MNGLENITNSNGWDIAIVGIGIVFSGLVLVSLAIAQIHKILHIWDNKKVYLKRLKGLIHPNGARAARFAVSGDLKTSVLQYHMISKTLGEPFALPKLLEVALNRGLDRPHSTINDLLHANIIIPDGEGFFQWSQNAHDKIIDLNKGK